MNISLEEWAKYRDMLAKLSQKAADEFRDAVWNKSGAFGGVGLAKIPRDDLIRYAHALVTKYGEASSELACEMHDAIALASKAKVAAAIPAETADMAEVGKTINGVLKTIEDPEAVSAVVGKMVKQAGQDTTLQMRSETAHSSLGFLQVRLVPSVLLWRQMGGNTHPRMPSKADMQNISIQIAIVLMQSGLMKRQKWKVTIRKNTKKCIIPQKDVHRKKR